MSISNKKAVMYLSKGFFDKCLWPNLYCHALRYGYAPYGFFKKIGIRGPKPLPFIGTFLEYKKVKKCVA